MGDLHRKGQRFRPERETRPGKETQRRCLSAREEWERTFDAIDDFVTILDPSLRVMRMNRAIAESFGIDRTAAAQVHCYELFWGKKSACRKCPAFLVLEDGKTHRAEFKNRVLDKTFLVSASPIFDRANGLSGLVYVTRDITERKRAEDALREARDKLESRVMERTAALLEANTRLKEEIAERRRAEALLSRQTRELNVKSQTLEEANIALRVMLKAREEDRTELEGKVASNIHELVLPHLNRLRNTRLTCEQASVLDVVLANLDDVISPFSRRLSSDRVNLTPREILTADLVKGGHDSKDIAAMLGVSLKTVEFHRENIRNKLGIRNRKINLRSHLLSFE